MVFTMIEERTRIETRENLANKIVGVPTLAQAVMAILLGRPNDARALPSTLLKTDKDSENVFDPDYPLSAYLRAVEILKAVEQFLREHTDQLSPKEVNNLKFYLAYFVTRLTLSKVRVKPNDLGDLDIGLIDRTVLARAYGEVREVL